MRAAGTWLPGNGVRPAPLVAPVAGSYIGVGDADISPLRMAALGTVSRREANCRSYAAS